MVRFPSQQKEGATQYSFHKHLCTEERALLPTHELKFNNKSIGKPVQLRVHEFLQTFGYVVTDKQKGSGKQLWFGDIRLDSPDIETELGHLIEHLFALAFIKEHVNNKRYQFGFLED